MEEKEIINYHAHVYYDPSEIPEVNKLLEKVSKTYTFKIGRVWDRPVGPHPVGSCQITVPTEEIWNFIPWLMKERENFDFFIHANTGDDLLDHTQYILWLGKSYELNLELFQDS